MTRSHLPVFVAVCCCATVLSSLLAGDPGRPTPDRPEPGAAGPIHNRVLDLLDGDVVLEVGGTGSSWESEGFATAQFNRIGLRITVAPGSLPVRCSVCWQFDAADECLDGGPFVHAPFEPPIGDGPLRPEPPRMAPTAASDLSAVRGLSARVRCRIPEVVFVGDDPDAPDETSATLGDVKVLLRRE